MAGNFCEDFNLANWRIGEFFTKSPKLIPPNTRAYVCGAHVFAKLKLTFLDQFANFNARQNNRLYGMPNLSFLAIFNTPKVDNQSFLEEPTTSFNMCGWFKQNSNLMSLDSSSIEIEVYNNGKTHRILKLLFFIYECAGI